MPKTTVRRHRHHNSYNLYGDIEKIKKAFANAASDVKGQTGEMFYQSIDSLKDKSDQIQNNVANFAAEKPFKTLGITLLAGVVIGFLLKLRR